jgi:hypothetical protein
VITDLHLLDSGIRHFDESRARMVEIREAKSPAARIVHRWAPHRRLQVERNSFLAGVAAGVALAYVMDPVSGGRRRALVRDKFVRAGNRTAEAVEGAAIDASNRARGLAAEARSTLRPEPLDDVRLIERVRAELGRVTTHPRTIDVSAMGGAVTLRGPVLSHEADRIVREVKRVAGVNTIYDRLDRHPTADIPALQGAAS